MKSLAALVLIIGVTSTGCFLNVTHYKATDGSIVYVGDFYNDVSGPGFSTAQVQGKFYDASNNLITTKTGFTCQGVNPKGVVPFNVTLPPGTAEPARVEWSMLDTPSDPFLATGLEASVTNTFAIGDRTFVVGELRNTSANVYVNGYPCASWTDAQGKVVRMTQGRVAGVRLGPGDVRPFEILVDTPPAGSTIHFYLDAGVTNVPGHVGPTAVDVPTSALQHGWGITFPSGDSVLTYGVSEVHNTSGTHFIPEAIATVRDASGKLVAVNSGDSQCSVNAAPGSFSFVTYDVTAPSSVTTSPDVSMQGYQYNDGPVYFPSVSGLSYHVTGLNVTATGMLTNTSSATLKKARVCVGSYNAAGAVQGAGMTTLAMPAGGLAPGATASFTVNFGDPFAVASVKAVADGFVR